MEFHIETADAYDIDRFFQFDRAGNVRLCN